MRNILFVLFMSGMILSSQTLKISKYEHLEQGNNGTRGDRPFPGNFSQGDRRRPPPSDFNGTFPERPHSQNGTRPFPPNFNGTFPNGEKGKFRPQMGQRPNNTLQNNQGLSHNLQANDLSFKNNEVDSRQPKKGNATNRDRNGESNNFDNKDQPKRKNPEQSNHLVADLPQSNLANPVDNEQFNWPNERVPKQKIERPKSQEREPRNGLDTNPQQQQQPQQKPSHLRSRQYPQDEGRRGEYSFPPEFDRAPYFRDSNERSQNFERPQNFQRPSFNQRQNRNSRRQSDNYFKDSYEPMQRRQPPRMRDFYQQRPQRRNQRNEDYETFGRRDYGQSNNYQRVHYESIENPPNRPRMEGSFERNGEEGKRFFENKQNRNEFN